MPFSLTERSPYQWMVREKLGNIPVDKIENFHLLLAAIRSILTSVTDGVSSAMLDYVNDLKEIYNNPQWYVAKQENYSEFRTLIKAEIEGAIKIIGF